jgi:DNA-binding GntR family transcriptional regulator
VYARLRDMIVTNALYTGQKLVDRELAQLLGVSRTPIREALGRLSMTGLVESRARRGYYVSMFSADQVSDLYEFRRILEINAARLAAQNARPEHLREFDHILGKLEKLTSEPRDHARAVKLDLEIHDLIARASGIRSLHQAVQGVLDKVMRFISMEIGDRDSLAAAHSQHRALLKAIKRKNAERAAELIRAHIEGAEESLLQVLQARDSLRNAVLPASPSRKDARTKQRSLQQPNKEERHERF